MNRNAFSITNKSSNNLTIIVEYIHWVEDLRPGKMFTVEVETTAEVDLLSLFDADYGEQSVIIYINTNMEYMEQYTFHFFIDDKKSGSVTF